MRMFIVLAAAVAVVAIVVKTVFIPATSTHSGSISEAMATSNTLSPHEIHLNYQNMKELPVHEVKDPF
jgi:hypothetical protein